MKIVHPNVKSPVFELVKTLVLDLEVGNDSFEMRLELFRDSAKSKFYRCHIWELEGFRLKPSAILVKSGRQRDVSDDLLPAERASRLKGNYGHFTAASEKAALQIVFQDLMERLEHWTGKKPKILLR